MLFVLRRAGEPNAGPLPEEAKPRKKKGRKVIGGPLDPSAPCTFGIAYAAEPPRRRRRIAVHFFFLKQLLHHGRSRVCFIQANHLSNVYDLIHLLLIFFSCAFVVWSIFHDISYVLACVCLVSIRMLSMVISLLKAVSTRAPAVYVLLHCGIFIC